MWVLFYVVTHWLPSSSTSLSNQKLSPVVIGNATPHDKDSFFIPKKKIGTTNSRTFMEREIWNYFQEQQPPTSAYIHSFPLTGRESTECHRQHRMVNKRRFRKCWNDENEHGRIIVNIIINIIIDDGAKNDTFVEYCTIYSIVKSISHKQTLVRHNCSNLTATTTNDALKLLV